MPFGQTINAGLYNPDYSAIERAGQAKGAGFAALGQGIGSALESLGKMKEQQKQEEREADTVASIAELIAKKTPDLIPGADQVALNLRNKDIPLSQRISEALAFKETLGLSFKIEQQMQDQQLFELQKQRMQQSLSNQGAGQQGPSFFGTPPDSTPKQPQGFTYPQ